MNKARRNAELRLLRLKTEHIDYVNFEEFVIFLCDDGGAKQRRESLN